MTSLPRASSRFVLAVALMTAAGCMRFSPYQIDLEDDERDQTAQNLNELDKRPQPNGSFRFAFVTDTHDGLDEFKDIVDAINRRHDIEFVLHGGDFTDFGTQQEYVWALEILKDLDVPFFVTAGNHDMLVNGPKVFQQMFGPSNYFFDWGGIKFVFFNTNTTELHQDHLDLGWLERTLTNEDPEPPGIVITHHPPDSRPQIPVDETDPYRQIQRDHGVFLNLHGHLHELTWAWQDGPTTYLRGAAALHSNFYVITVNGNVFYYEHCVPARCDPPGDVIPTWQPRPP